MPRKTFVPADTLPNWDGFNEAAARCRGKPPRDPDGRAAASRASMRPRPDAAENTVPLTTEHPPVRRFNEAAARCRGKLGQPPDDLTRILASMRPRPDAAENATRAAGSTCGDARLQ